MQDAATRMIASVGSRIVGFSRSSTRTSPGACMMTPRMVVFSLVAEFCGSRTERRVARRRRGHWWVGGRGAGTRRRRGATATVVTTPRGRMLSAPATPTSGAATPPNPNRTMPSSDEAVPAICGYSTSASVVAGGDGDRDAAGEEEQRHDHDPQRHRGEARREQAERRRARRPAMPTARVPAMLHRSAARPARYPKVMKPAELSPNASGVRRAGRVRRCPAARRSRRRGRRTAPRRGTPG